MTHPRMELTTIIDALKTHSCIFSSGRGIVWQQTRQNVISFS